jgi:hypothetical protein
MTIIGNLKPRVLAQEYPGTYATVDVNIAMILDMEFESILREYRGRNNTNPSSKFTTPLPYQRI